MLLLSRDKEHGPFPGPRLSQAVRTSGSAMLKFSPVSWKRKVPSHLALLQTLLSSCIPNWCEVVAHLTQGQAPISDSPCRTPEPSTRQQGNN